MLSGRFPDLCDIYTEQSRQRFDPTDSIRITNIIQSVTISNDNDSFADTTVGAGAFVNLYFHTLILRVVHSVHGPLANICSIATQHYPKFYINAVCINLRAYTSAA